MVIELPANLASFRLSLFLSLCGEKEEEGRGGKLLPFTAVNEWLLMTN